MAVVVGKGPSLKGRRLGSWIDSFNTIIRLVRGNCDDDYGHECDYLVTTTQQYKSLKLENNPTVWIYKTRGKVSRVLDYIENSLRTVVLDGKVAHYINWYTKHYDRQKLDTHRTWYPSKGTVAIIAVMCLLKDDVIAVGFDSALAGKKWPKRMTHDFECERRLLKRVSQDMGRKLLVLY